MQKTPATKVCNTAQTLLVCQLLCNDLQSVLWLLEYVAGRQPCKPARFQGLETCCYSGTILYCAALTQWARCIDSMRPSIMRHDFVLCSIDSMWHRCMGCIGAQRKQTSDLAVPPYLAWRITHASARTKSIMAALWLHMRICRRHQAEGEPARLWVHQAASCAATWRQAGLVSTANPFIR